MGTRIIIEIWIGKVEGHFKNKMIGCIVPYINIGRRYFSFTWLKRSFVSGWIKKAG